MQWMHSCFKGFVFRPFGCRGWGFKMFRPEIRSAKIHSGPATPMDHLGSGRKLGLRIVPWCLAMSLQSSVTHRRKCHHHSQDLTVRHRVS